MTRKLLELSGIGADRLHLAWVSSAEAQRFASLTSEVVASVTRQGPLQRDRLQLQLEAARRTLDSEPVRWTLGKEKNLLETGDVYARKWTREAYETVLDTILEQEYQQNLIYAALRQGCESVYDIRDRIGLQPPRISFLLAQMEKGGLVELRSLKDSKPKFSAVAP